MPYYQGSLSADWSTGAPSAYNAATSSGMGFNVPAALATAMATRGEAIALLKGNVPTAGARALVSLTGATALIYLVRAGTSAYQPVFRNDAGATVAPTLATALVAGEFALAENFDITSTTEFYVGSPPVAGAPSSSVLAAPVTLTGGTIMSVSSTFGSMDHSLRELALFSTKRTSAERAAIVAGMVARAQATA